MLLVVVLALLSLTSRSVPSRHGRPLLPRYKWRENVDHYAENQKIWLCRQSDTKCRQSETYPPKVGEMRCRRNEM